MNCTEVRESLPLWVYGDLPPAQQAEIQTHLAACATCRGEEAALRQFRELLTATPAPAATVDVAGIYRRQAEALARSQRRWRRIAVLVSGLAAACLLLVVGTRIEARLDAHQLVVRWGALPPPAEPALPVAPAPTPPPPAGPPERPSNAQTELLAQLIHALADQVENLERLQSQQTRQVNFRLQNLRQEDLQRWAEVKHSVDALYLLARKGD